MRLYLLGFLLCLSASGCTDDASTIGTSRRASGDAQARADRGAISQFAATNAAPGFEGERGATFAPGVLFWAGCCLAALALLRHRRPPREASLAIDLPHIHPEHASRSRDVPTEAASEPCSPAVAQGPEPGRAADFAAQGVRGGLSSLVIYRETIRVDWLINRLRRLAPHRRIEAHQALRP
jgi:hypothetical protein